jgi:hypothetical protein
MYLLLNICEKEKPRLNKTEMVGDQASARSRNCKKKI